LVLLFIQAMLLVPISPLALMLAPTIIGSWRRLAVHRSADPLQHVTRALRVRWHRTQHENQRKSQDRPLYHFHPPFAPLIQKGIPTFAAVSNTAGRVSVPVLILLPLHAAGDRVAGLRLP